MADQLSIGKFTGAFSVLHRACASYRNVWVRRNGFDWIFHGVQFVWGQLDALFGFSEVSIACESTPIFCCCAVFMCGNCKSFRVICTLSFS